METTQLLIIGAGPAGTAAAIEAARRGLDAITIDKATFPRPKICGDGLTTGALRHLQELGVDPATIPSWRPVNEVVLAAPSGKEIRYQFPDSDGTYAVTARRSELDDSLVRQARAVGADVREATSLIELTPGSISPGRSSDRAVATVSGPDGSTYQVAAELVVAADGMWSPTRKLLNLDVGSYRGDWHAFRQYFRSTSPRASQDLIVWFEPDILPGYVWSFPLADGGVNVGFGIQRGGAHQTAAMKGLWADLLARPRIAEFLGPEAEPEEPHRAWPIPARLGQLPLSHERVVFVGDAAAATDPMSGEGIGQALETGRLLLASYLHHRSDVAATIDRYRAELKLGMERDHTMARSLSSILASPARAEWTLRTTALSPWTRRNFVRWLFEDYPRATVVNPHRWERKVFRQPAPFNPNQSQAS